MVKEVKIKIKKKRFSHAKYVTQFTKIEDIFLKLEPMPRIELGTSSLPRKRSTTELHRLVTF